jgi:hypothetical protein
MNDAAKSLSETIERGRAFDQEMTRLAEEEINPRLLEADDEEDDEEDVAPRAEAAPRKAPRTGRRRSEADAR